MASCKACFRTNSSSSPICETNLFISSNKFQMKIKTIKKEISSEELRSIKTQIERIIFKDQIPKESLSSQSNLINHLINHSINHLANHPINHLINPSSQPRSKSSIQMRSNAKKVKSSKQIHLAQSHQAKSHQAQSQQKKGKPSETAVKMKNSTTENNISSEGTAKKSQVKECEEKEPKKKNLFQMWGNIAGGIGSNNANSLQKQKPVKEQHVTFNKVQQQRQQIGTGRAQVLKDKYKLLDARLRLIKQRFKKSRGDQSSRSKEKQARRQEINNGQWSALGYYQRYSPLKKLLKVNGNLREYQKHYEIGLLSRV